MPHLLSFDRHGRPLTGKMEFGNVMCIAIPSRIVDVNGFIATVDVSGARREISLLLLPEAAEKGDYVLVHAGFAIHKVDEGAAAETLNLLSEIVASLEAEEETSE